jgi:NADPH2:quinone reductase
VGDDLVYAYDAVNDVDGQILTLNSLSSYKKGRMARLLPTGPVDESKVLGKKSGFEVLDVLGSSQYKPDLAKPFWERVPSYLENKQLTPLKWRVEEGLDADKVNKILDSYWAGDSTRVHLHI